MKKETFKALIDGKTTQVVHALSKINGLQYSGVFSEFCASDTYRKLADEETKYWRESAPYILDSFIAEQNNKPTNDDY